MELNIESISNVGIVRKNNEDYIFDGARFIRDDEHFYNLTLDLSNTKLFFAIADGMGGHNAGELASEILLTELYVAVKEIFKYSTILSENEIRVFFDSEVKKIHNLLIEEGYKNPNAFGMGSTLIAFVIYYGNFYMINVGDSRLYRLRDGFLKQFSKDHSYNTMFGDSRSTTHLIYNAVGGGDRVFTDFTNLTSKIEEDDTILLCSDGLTDMLDDEIIEEILNDDGSVKDLVNSAIQAGGEDNVSIIKIKLTKI